MTKRAYIGVGGKARKIKKIYLGADNFERRTLPEGYTQIEYIESSGTQYIDTGFQPNQDTRVIMVFEPIAAGRGLAVFGARVPGTSPTKAFNCFIENETAIRSAYTGSFVDFTTTILNRHEIDHNARSVTLDEQYQAHQQKTFAVTCSLFLFCLNHGGVAQLFSKAKCYSCKIYDNGKQVRDLVPCTNQEGAVGLYDLISKSFFSNAGTGVFAKGPACKTIARRVKRAYLGVGGVARPFLTGGELSYYGAVSPLNEVKDWLAATTIGNYALFGGGCTGNDHLGYSNLATVDAYTKSLVHTAPTDLSEGRRLLAATSVGDYAIFGGGFISKFGFTASTAVDAYNRALIRSTPANLWRRGMLAATSIGEYALFGGGKEGAESTSRVEAYNKALVKSLPSSLNSFCDSLAAASVGDYALFGGGQDYEKGSRSDKVTAYNQSLVRSTPTGLSGARAYLAATTIGNYALFGGGDHFSSAVDAYNQSLVRSTPASLSSGRGSLSATSVGDYALFGGGYGNRQPTTGSNFFSGVDAYTETLTVSTLFWKSEGRAYLAATTIGNYALFGGGAGVSGNTSFAEVDAYLVA